MLTAVRYKIKAMTGGAVRFLAILLCAVVCFTTVNGILRAEKAHEIVIAFVDEDDTEVSGMLEDSLQDTAGIRLLICTEDAAAEHLAAGRAEAVLIVGRGFERSFRREKQLPLQLKCAPGTGSSRVASEIIGGVVLSLQSRSDAQNRLKEDDLWNRDAEREYEKYYRAAEENALPLAVFTEEAMDRDPTETPVFGEFYARYSGFSGLFLMLLMLSLSVWLGDVSTFQVNLRTAVIPGGRLYACLTDEAAILLPGLVTALCALLCKRSSAPAEYASYFAYVYALSGICLLIGRANVAGGVQTGAAYLAVLSSVLGGCFFDYSSLGGIFALLPLLTPQGHFIRAVSGNVSSLLILLGAGLLTTLLAIGKEKRGAVS